MDFSLNSSTNTSLMHTSQTHCSHSAEVELTAVELPLTSEWKPSFWLTCVLWGNLARSAEKEKLRRSVLLEDSSNCSFLLLPNRFLHRSSVQHIFLIFCLLYMKVLTAPERFFLHLLTLLCACKWGDLDFKRFVAVFKLGAVGHPWATWPFFSSLPPSLYT